MNTRRGAKGSAFIILAPDENLPLVTLEVFVVIAVRVLGVDLQNSLSRDDGIVDNIGHGRIDGHRQRVFARFGFVIDMQGHGRIGVRVLFAQARLGLGFEFLAAAGFEILAATHLLREQRCPGLQGLERVRHGGGRVLVIPGADDMV